MSIITLKENLALVPQGAVGAFSTFDLFTAQGIIMGAERANRPVIMMIGARVLNRPGNEEIGSVMVKLAKEAKVPVTVFLDHAPDFESCMKAIRLGFSTVMIDGSALPLAENISLVRQVTEAAHAAGVSVEAELGALSGIEDGAEGKLMLTDPKEVPGFVEATGIDALAISIGNAHGLYHGIPELHFEVLEESRKLTQIPLVLHGGTGLSREQFAMAVSRSMRKVNIGTEIKRAFMDKFTEMHLAAKDSYDLPGVLQEAKAAVASVVAEDLEFFAEGWRKLVPTGRE